MSLLLLLRPLSSSAPGQAQFEHGTLQRRFDHGQLQRRFTSAQLTRRP